MDLSKHEPNLDLMVSPKFSMELLKLDPNLKSIVSPSAYFEIVNGTNLTVDIYWINFESDMIRLATLQPFTSTPMNTYTKHPWIFIDNSTGQLLHVNNQTLLYGKSLDVYNKEKDVVHLPMKSLQDITLLSLMKHLKRVDAVDELEISQSLKQDLRYTFLICEDNRKRLNGERQRRLLYQLSNRRTCFLNHSQWYFKGYP